MGEETDLYWRIKNHGGKCIYYPSAIVYHCIDSKKMTKNYIRKWFFKIGEWYYYSDMLLMKGANSKILGIPWCRYKKAFRNLLGLLWYCLRNSRADVFSREVSIIFFLGYCFKRVKTFFAH